MLKYRKNDDGSLTLTQIKDENNLNVYQINHIAGDAGFEETSEETIIEAKTAQEALSDWIAYWPIKYDAEEDTASASNPEYEYEYCRYCDYYEAIPMELPNN